MLAGDLRLLAEDGLADISLHTHTSTHTQAHTQAQQIGGRRMHYLTHYHN